MVHTRFSLEDLVSLLERLCPSVALTLFDDHVHAECSEAPYDARVTGSDSGRLALSFVSPLGAVESFEDHFPLTKLIASVGSTAGVRVVIDRERLALEARVVHGDVAPGQLESVVRWHLTELVAVSRAWRRRLGLVPDPPSSASVTTLADLVRTTPVAPQKALLVAAVGFAVAGADGRLSPTEAARLHTWLTDVPSFAALDQRRVIAAIATLVGDSARTLLEARRRLDARERLLAWALANDMAHADGFSSPDEQRYLSSVASIFELSPDDMEPFIADAQERAVRRETPMIPPAVVQH